MIRLERYIWPDTVFGDMLTLAKVEDDSVDAPSSATQ
jgi:hypothetical protein